MRIHDVLKHYQKTMVPQLLDGTKIKMIEEREEKEMKKREEYEKEIRETLGVEEWLSDGREVKLMLHINQDFINRLVDVKIENDEEIEKKDKMIAELNEKIKKLEKVAVDSCKASPVEINFHREFTEFKDEMTYLIKKGIADNIHKSYFDSDENSNDSVDGDEQLKDKIRVLTSNSTKLGETIESLQKKLYKKEEEIKKLKEGVPSKDEVKEEEKDKFGISGENPKLFELSIEQIASIDVMTECLTNMVKAKLPDVFANRYKIGVKDDLYDFFFPFYQNYDVDDSKVDLISTDKCNFLRYLGERFRILGIKQILVRDRERDEQPLVDTKLFDEIVEKEFERKGKFFLIPTTPIYPYSPNNGIGATIYFIEDLVKLHEEYNEINPPKDLGEFLASLNNIIHELDPGAFVIVFGRGDISLTHIFGADNDIFGKNWLPTKELKSESFRVQNPLSKEVFQILSNLHPCVTVYKKCSPNILVVRDKSKMGNFADKSKGDIIFHCLDVEKPVESIQFNFSPSSRGESQDVHFSNTIRNIIDEDKNNILVTIDDWEGFKIYCSTFGVHPLGMISEFLTDRDLINITFLIFEANPHAYKYGELHLK